MTLAIAHDLWLVVALAAATVVGILWLVLRNDQDRRRLDGIDTRLDTVDRTVTTLRGEILAALERGLGDNRTAEARALAELRNQLTHQIGELKGEVKASLGNYEQRAERRHQHALKVLHDSLTKGIQSLQTQVITTVSRSGEALGRQVERLTHTTDERLKDISGQVEKRLAEGFDKTTRVFADVQKRLALIDQAQQRITELSTSVVSLHEVLADKRSRGAFGEVQLAALVRNVMPETSFSLQHTLPNGTRADCVLFLPDPTGHVVIDAKFPLESWQRLSDNELAPESRQAAARQFKQDVKRHIHDIAEKYIIPGTTADGAVMFIPAEAVFAEIQAHHPDLVDEGFRGRVWMCSPTTMMAVLNTARAVLKDDATRRQIHIIQDHLAWLAKDFDRFRRRMDALARHIRQANKDVEDVNVSAGKIADRFQRIEQVELADDEDAGSVVSLESRKSDLPPPS